MARAPASGVAGTVTCVATGGVTTASAQDAPGWLTRLEASVTPPIPRSIWLILAGLTGTRKPALKWARSAAAPMGR